MKKRRTISKVPPFAVAFLFLCLSVASVHAQRPSSAWGTIPSPNAGFGPNELFDVEVLSENDIWAVGNFGDFVAPEPQVQHWDGTSWQLVTLPGEFIGDLLGVSAVAANDVWFVGGAASTGETFIFHWDGTSISRVTSPNPGLFNRLYDVVALAANNVWAVGEYASGGVSKTLIEHWDGAKWSVVPSPTSRNEYTELLGVAAVSANDIWAVGEAGSKPYALHWDGTTWQQVTTPNLPFARFTDVSATSGGEVWAVGDSSNGTLTARWTGSAWQVVPSPSPGGFINDLNGVVVLAPDDVYAVGYYDVFGDWKTLALHYDGAQWTQVSSPSLHPSINLFNGVDADAQNNVWAVGKSEGTLTAQLTSNTFQAVQSANAGVGGNELNSISAISSTDIWAVGEAEGDSLSMHWDGVSWSLVPVPDLPLDAPLEGVETFASNDVWAVGYMGEPSSSNSSNVILHWTGSAWNVVPSPNPGGNDVDKLHDVQGAAPNDIWAVGEHWDRTGTQRATILRYNGATWTEFPNACGGPLYGVTVIAPDDVWAVGYQSCHFDGTSWTQIPIPSSGGGDTLLDVSAVSSDDVWAVGFSAFCNGMSCTFAAYSAHWNGTQWQFIPAPGSSLGGVQALATNNVYAVGTFSLGTVIARWNGRDWRLIPSPDPETGGGLNEITATPGKLWAVGSFYDDDIEQRTLIVDTPSATQGTITGNVGVSGATVSWFGAVNGSTTTDIFGNFGAAGLPAGTYTLIATADGCDPGIANVRVVAGRTVRKNLEIDCGAIPLRPDSR